MEKKIHIHLGEIHRFDDPQDPYMRVHVKFNNPSRDNDELWHSDFVFMIKESDESLKSIEKRALIKAKEHISNALKALDELV